MTTPIRQKTPKPKESVIEDYLYEQIINHGGQCFKFSAAIKTGVPDRIIVLNQVVFVELKAPGKKPRPRQIARHAEIRESGADVYVIDTKKQVDELVKYLTNLPKPTLRTKDAELTIPALSVLSFETQESNS